MKISRTHAGMWELAGDYLKASPPIGKGDNGIVTRVRGTRQGPGFPAARSAAISDRSAAISFISISCWAFWRMASA